MPRSDFQRALTDLAMSQVGVHETGDNSGPVVEMYQAVLGKPHKEPWCVAFVQWCVAEIDKRFGAHTLLYATESSQELWQLTPKVAQVLRPEAGCIAVWTKYAGEQPTQYGHCGIVREVLDHDWFLSVEGNTSAGPGIQREGDGVYAKRRRIAQATGPLRIAGFLLPWA